MLLGSQTRAAAPEKAVRVDIGTMRLLDAIVQLGAQTHVTIALDDPSLSDAPIRAVHRRATPGHVLDMMLRGTGAVAREVAPGAFRIGRARSPAKPAPQRSRGADGSQIIVTGSKRGLDLASYPGSAIVADTGSIALARQGHGSDALVASQPILSSTHLGPGRNKLFIRGVADSSFNGPSQSTVGQYLGDARLTYNAPDPDLALYDIAETEILEGPQGTLYGAGALGGIVRLVPVMPDLARSHFGVSAGGATTRQGAASYDVAGLANLPLLTDVAGLRAVAYRIDEGGYIDDPGRGLRDINRTQTWGGRIDLRVKPAGDWTIDLLGVIQNINSRDGNYTQRGLPRMQRESAIAQPFDNDYSLAGISVRHGFGNFTLTSTTSIVRHDVEFNYDATLSGAEPRLFREQNHITLLTNETRLAHRSANGSSWVIGLEALHNKDSIEEQLGRPAAPATLSGSRNIVSEGAIFGEATLALSHRFSLTAGARLSLNLLSGEVTSLSVESVEPNRRSLVFLPSLGATWRLNEGFALYARYQEGFRPGGLSVTNDRVERYRGDGLATVELGARLGAPSARLQASAALSYARWKNIQADLVEQDGLPYTTNVGDGRIVALEAQARWKPIRVVSLTAGLFLNDSTLDRPAAGFTGERDASLPNVDDLGFHLRADIDLPVGRDQVKLYGAVRYVGGSKLAVGSAFDYPQGHYLATVAGLRWTHKGVTVTCDVDNLLDDGRNQFALGNPFQLAAGNQMTPLRPRSVRLGFSTGF